MKYYIIAGEASGDLHASNLMRELSIFDIEALFRCWGGDLMQKAGGEMVKHYREMNFMGFWEVFLNIRTILKNIALCKRDIIDYFPDAIILVDYPGFNLRIAEFVKKFGLKTKVFYYISPQVWAWHQKRIKKIKQFVDKMFVILPFERDFYKKFDYDVEFVGHPLFDAIEQRKNKKIASVPPTVGRSVPSDDRDTTISFRLKNNLSDKPIIALFPGSRKQEIANILPIMLSISDDYPDYQFVIAGTESVGMDFYNKFILQNRVKIVFEQTYELLENSVAAIVKSGTSTLESALYEVPQAVCYKGSSISFQIAKQLVNVNYISLVNLIMNKEVVKELIQTDFNKNSLKAELSKILNNHAYRDEIIKNYKVLKEKLGGPGASRRTAILILKNLLNIS